MTEKQCKICGEVKPLTLFAFGQKSRLCKECRNRQDRIDYRTPEGLAHRGWCNILNRLRKRRTYSRLKCNMTKEEFTAWALPEYAKALERNASECWTVDRIDNDKHYELGNLQILTRSENSRKSWVDRKRRQAEERQGKAA